MSDKGFTVGEGPDFIPMEGDGQQGYGGQLNQINQTYGEGKYKFHINGIQGLGFYKKNLPRQDLPRQNNTFDNKSRPEDISWASNKAMASAR